jgi:stage II sporulation protein D
MTQEVVQPRHLQVLLTKEATEALVEVRGPYTLFNPESGAKVASGLLGKRFLVRELDSGLKWGEEFLGIHQLYLHPNSSKTVILVNGVQHQGGIVIYGVSGVVNIVNDLDIEAYVKSILSSHFTSSMEPEVLSALAILIRTDAYYRATQSDQSFWHVQAQEVSYPGVALTSFEPPIEKAVESTKHLLLVHPGEGRYLPFATTWTEHCAGKTASYATIFRKQAATPDHGVKAPHAALVKEASKWSVSLSKSALKKALHLPTIDSIETFVDATSDKTYGLRFHSGQKVVDADFVSLQKKLGPKVLISSQFEVKDQGDHFLLTGFGKGHGAGLCLYSATALAQNGDNAVKILSKFFPETCLYNINALPTQ